MDKSSPRRDSRSERQALVASYKSQNESSESDHDELGEDVNLQDAYNKLHWECMKLVKKSNRLETKLDEFNQLDEQFKKIAEKIFGEMK